MKVNSTPIAGVFEIIMFRAEDSRGSFNKAFQQEEFDKHGLVTDFKESFYSVNHKNVIRGMHFQHPPHDHTKLVYATAGIILDVVLDLRKASKTFGQFATIEISGENNKAVYMPSGVAHGFFCKTAATMIYLTSAVHNSNSDDGIRWDSFGMKWPGEAFIISERDGKFQSLKELKSPF